jgi:glycerol kinase
MNTGSEIINSKSGLISTIAASPKGSIQYALEGSIFVGGAVMQWLRDEMGLIRDSKDAGILAASVKDTAGVYLVPAFTGLGAPHWDMYARGTLIGITRATKKEHIIRAAEEAIALQSYDLVKAIEADIGHEISELRVDGGASRDNFLMQFQADILQKQVVRPMIRESTALGAAYLAGLCVGVWKNIEEIKKLWHIDTTFKPLMDTIDRDKKVNFWHKAVQRSKNWAEE